MTTKSKAREQTIEPTVTLPQLLVEGSDAAFRQFIHDMLAFSARLQAIRSELGGLIGLSGTQYTVLIAIAHLSGHDAKIGVNHVAEHLHFSGAFITIEINKLVASGLVEKEVDGEDRRRVVLAITPKARALLNELAPTQRPVNDMLFREMTAADFEQFRKFVSGMVEAADGALDLFDEGPAPKGSAR
jgi:DNA-binding MarR family transcriptional regulator